MLEPLLDPEALRLARKARETGLCARLESPSGLGGLLIQGRDAATFLHGQLTSDVKALQPGQGSRSARVNRAGKLLFICSLHRFPEQPGQEPAFLALLEPETAARLGASLEQFLFSEEVRIQDLSAAYDWLILQGPYAPAVAERAWGPLEGESWAGLPEDSMRVLVHAQAPAGTLAIQHSLTGDPGFLFAVPKGGGGQLAAPAALLAGCARRHELACAEGPALAAALEILRIEAGLVRAEQDFKAEERVLPETGLEQQVVSYSKGCYLGQEVIARIRTYGSTHVALRGLVLRSPDQGEAPRDPLPGSQERQAAGLLEHLPAIGADLRLQDGKVIGQAASRCFSPTVGAVVLMAYLDRQHRTPGAEFTLAGSGGGGGAAGAVRAKVVLLPFHQAPDRGARARFLHERAVQVFSRHQDDLAVTLLEEAIRLDPSYGDAYEALGVILGRLERFHEAIDLFRRLEEVAPNEPMVHSNLSLFYMKIGDKTAAEEQKALATVKRFGQFATQKEAKQRAEEEARRRKEDAVRKKAMFLEVLEIDAQDPVALFGLGNACMALEEYQAAEGAYARAMAVQTDNSAVYLARGKALEQLGRKDEARAVYRLGLDVAARKGDLMPLREMEHRVTSLDALNQ